MPRFAKRTLFIAILSAVMVGSLAGGLAANKGTVVIFDASWCANCRDIVPVVQEVAHQNNLSVVEIDIDQQNAPKQAQSYGLSIPSEDPPQVFYVDRGRSTRLFSGRNYKYGQSDSVRSAMQQSLQNILQP